MSADKAKCPLCEGDGSYVETIGDGSVKIECAMCEGTGRIAVDRKPHEGPRSDQRPPEKGQTP